MVWMSDEVYEYVQDCKDKKITARSARNKKTHTGKGGPVRLPSDHLTKKERESMNGECKSYRMNDPISWEEFKSWPKEHQETYIKLLRKRYNAPISAISKMFGLYSNTLNSHILRNKLNVGPIQGGNRVWDKEGFLAWASGAKEGVVLHSETPVEEDDLIVIREEPEVVTPEMETKLHDLVKDDINIPENDADQLLKETEEQETEDAVDGRGTRNAIDDWCGMDSNEFHEMAKQSLDHCKCETNTVVPCNGEMTFQGNADDILRTITKLLDGRQVRLEVEWEVLG